MTLISCNYHYSYKKRVISIYVLFSYIRVQFYRWSALLKKSALAVTDNPTSAIIVGPRFWPMLNKLHRSRLSVNIYSVKTCFFFSTIYFFWYTYIILYYFPASADICIHKKKKNSGRTLFRPPKSKTRTRSGIHPVVRRTCRSRFVGPGRRVGRHNRWSCAQGTAHDTRTFVVRDDGRVAVACLRRACVRACVRRGASLVGIRRTFDV